MLHSRWKSVKVFGVSIIFQTMALWRRKAPSIPRRDQEHAERCRATVPIYIV
jgi:hypothetical protein